MIRRFIPEMYLAIIYGSLQGYEFRHHRGHARLDASIFTSGFNPQGQTRSWTHKGCTAAFPCRRASSQRHCKRKSSQTSPLPTSRTLPTKCGSSTTHPRPTVGHVVVVALVEEEEDAATLEVDGTLVLHVTQRTYFVSGEQRLTTACCTVRDNHLLRSPASHTPKSSPKSRHTRQRKKIGSSVT